MGKLSTADLDRFIPGTEPSEPDARGERELWSSVIKRAFDDVGLKEKKKDRVIDYGAEAAKWVASEDFAFVCELVDMEPDILRRRFFEHHNRTNSANAERQADEPTWAGPPSGGDGDGGSE